MWRTPKSGLIKNVIGRFDDFSMRFASPSSPTSGSDQSAYPTPNFSVKASSSRNKLGWRGLAILGGIIMLMLWLLFWNWLTGGAAQPFALATALFATVAFGLAELLKQNKSWAALPKISGWLAAITATLAALSVGTFLPAGLAEFFSPVLGRFGGMAGLGVLALLFAGLALWRRQSWMLDLGLGCGLGAAWVGPSVARQAQFPPPPTTAQVQAERLDTIFFIILLFGLLGVALAIWPVCRRYARSFWRWGSFLALLGLSLALLLNLGEISLRYALLLAAFWISGGIIFIGIGRKTHKITSLFLLNAFLKYLGVVLLMLLATALLYFITNDDLEGVLLRNTLERHTATFWRGIWGDERFTVRPSGQIAGRVTDEQGRPLAGATVLVAGVAGQTYTAITGADGRYLIKEVPAGNHLPLAARFGYRDEVARSESWLDSGRMVVTVQAGQTQDNVNFSLKPRPAPAPLTADKTLQITATGPAFRDNPVPSPVLRSTFTFENDGRKIEGGLIHEPEAAKGNGPFPTLLIIYPGPANAWEGVSIPLAAQGYVVISYYPTRGIDLAGDMRDISKIMAFSQAGLFSKRADPNRITVIGGSVSTAYAYLLLRELEGSPAHDKVKAAVMYGGLADMYRFRYDWERGALYIDPGISQLEDLLVAFGRPDNRPEHYLLFSPLYHLDKAALPPTLLVHAEKDSIVPVNQSQLIDQKLIQLSSPHQFLLYKDIEHYLDMSKRDPSQLDMLYQTIDFLKTYAAN